MKELEGKSAIVLGASSPKGIGETIARKFAEQGAKVAVCGRKIEAVQALANDINGTAVACDITDEAQISSALEEVVSKHGKVDIAVNAAGINASQPIAEMTAADLRTISESHFVGPVMFIKHAASKMMEHGGSIITLSSLTAELTGAGLGYYAGTKAATDKIVQIAALEYGSHNIRVNSLSPGLTRTPMTEAFFQMPTLTEAFKKEMPLGDRLITADDVAFAAAYLANDRCVATGDNIRVSGGAHLQRLPRRDEMMGG